MAKKKSSKFNVEAKAVAKVEASAKASFQRKKTITEVVPPDVTRAKANAWLDIISPITEWAGLKGDDMRHKRELLRIQREDVLTKIIERASRSVSMDNRTTVPTKFVVPFLEKASLEEPDSDLIDIWSSLLTAAATDFNPHMTRFCSILAEIGSMEVQFLHRLCRESRGRRKRLEGIEDAPLNFSHIELVKDINNTIDPTETAEHNIDKIIQERESPGALLLVIGVDDFSTSEQVQKVHDLDEDKWEASISLLQSLGLVENSMFISGEVERFGWFGESVALTSFGVAFVSACDHEVRRSISAI
jgi:hypothetical protein